MTKLMTCRSPIDNSSVAERPFTTEKQAQKIIIASNQAQIPWAQISITDRATLCHRAITILLSNSNEIALDISRQIARPIRFCPGELRAVEERALYMIDNAEQALSNQVIEDNNHTKRFISREPLGVVFIIAPWNYPYLTAINAIIPALMAGNSVILKHASQTLLCAEQLFDAFKEAGFPKAIFQTCFCDHQITNKIIKDPGIHYISFTGSVASGAKLEKSVAGFFKHVALELGGNDPAYVRADLDPDSTLFKTLLNDIIDGAYFNSGQSCCAVERIYVHEKIYDSFTEQFIAQVKKYQLGNPLETNTTLGPVISTKAAKFIHAQLLQAESAGAVLTIANNYFNENDLPENYIAPQVLVNVDQTMDIMRVESFAPIVGIMKVRDDAHAIQLMNDSNYGLTASIWSSEKKPILDIANKLQTGTVFLNKCDYLDPALAWVGIKDSGRGCSLSTLAYLQFTRAKSFNLHFNNN